MNTSLEILLLTAASLGFIHTITGPDHYIPLDGQKWMKYTFMEEIFMEDHHLCQREMTHQSNWSNLFRSQSVTDY